MKRYKISTEIDRFSMGVVLSNRFEIVGFYHSQSFTMQTKLENDGFPRQIHLFQGLIDSGVQSLQGS